MRNQKRMYITLGPGKRGHIVGGTLLPTQMNPRLPARATFVADTKFVSGTQKMFLILFRNILCPQQMFPSLRSPRNIMGNNVSATMCPRLPGPFDTANVEIASSKEIAPSLLKGCLLAGLLSYDTLSRFGNRIKTEIAKLMQKAHPKKSMIRYALLYTLTLSHPSTHTHECNVPSCTFKNEPIPCPVPCR